MNEVTNVDEEREREREREIDSQIDKTLIILRSQISKFLSIWSSQIVVARLVRVGRLGE